MRVDISTAPLDPSGLLSDFTCGLPADTGAVVSFTGLMRATSTSGEPLASLILHAYRSMTLASIEQIASTGMARFALHDVLVIHRTGQIRAGEAIVFVATAAAHRRVAFEGADWLMDKLKTEAMLWKAEESAQGSKHWIEPTSDDYSAAARWARTSDAGDAG